MFDQAHEIIDRYWPAFAIGILILGLVAVVVVFRSTRAVAKARRQVEEANREKEEANIIKNDFVAMVSHELRTPLTSVSGFAEMLGSAWRDMPETEVDEFLGIITKQAHYLGDLVEDILVIPRLEAGRLRLYPELFDLSDLVHEVGALIFPADGPKRASISIPGGVRVWGDPRRAQQVIRNLMENARKYGGSQVLVEGFPLGEHFVLIVSDNGPGIPDDMVDVVFEHFEQISKGDSRSSTGIGLGLPIARKLARAMGGEVWFERRFPTGARFCFSIAQSEAALIRVMQERAVGSETAGDHSPRESQVAGSQAT